MITVTCTQTTMMSSMMIMTSFSLPKYWTSLSLKNIISCCSSKWDNWVLESTEFCIKCGQEWRSFMKLLMPITFSVVTYSNDTGFCKQMGNIFWHFEVIWLLHNCFIEIGWVKTYSKLEISLLIPALYQYKAVDPRSCLVYRFQNSCL